MQAIALALAIAATPQAVPAQLAEGMEICEAIAAYNKRWNDAKATHATVQLDDKTAFTCRVKFDVIHERSDRRVQEEAQP